MRAVEVPKVFVDETSARILLAAFQGPRTAMGIQRASGVPVAEVYSRLVWLRQKGLIKVVGHELDRRDREVPLYRAELYDAYVFTENGHVRVRFQLVACGQAEMAFDAEAFI